MHAISSARILPLSQQLANQIAAGEVVERPASVVKELLENSVDAGARRVAIEVEEGGSRLIRVRDDGHGIHADDLLLALSPHATSKIRDHAGLTRVLSLGFRGEALASIASVSRLRLTSRRVDAATAWGVAAEGGACEAPQPAAHPAGTTIEVRDLFFNTPARRKFLRSERTELQNVQEVVKRIGLSRPDLTLTLSHGERALLRLAPAADRAGEERRLAQVVGAAFLREAVALDLEAAGLRLRGWLATPTAARAQADIQYFFVNGRVVRDRLIGHALRHAHNDLLPEGRHPAYVLFMELDPAQVDVNVHPTKHEVRFRETRMVHDFIVRAISEGLAGARGDDTAAPVPVAAPAPPAPCERDAVREPAGGGYRAAAQPQRPARRPEPSARSGDGVVDYGLLFPTREPQVAPTPVPATPAPRYLAQAGAYILAQWQGELLVVDAAAALRRSARRRLEEGLTAGALAAVPLLVPHTLRVDPDQAAVAEAQAEQLAALGVEMARLGPDRVVVRALPSPLREADPGPLAEALLALLAGGRFEPQAAVACLAGHAGRGQAPLDPAERDRLLREAVADGDSALWRRVDEAALAAWFGRPQ